MAIAQSICLYRKRHGIDGPLFLGIDTRLSRPAFVTALEVFVANDVVTMIDADNGYTPTPVISPPSSLTIAGDGQDSPTGWS